MFLKDKSTLFNMMIYKNKNRTKMHIVLIDIDIQDCSNGNKLTKS
jgi:hypothetical protein